MTWNGLSQQSFWHLLKIVGTNKDRTIPYHSIVQEELCPKWRSFQIIKITFYAASTGFNGLDSKKMSKQWMKHKIATTHKHTNIQARSILGYLCTHPHPHPHTNTHIQSVRIAEEREKGSYDRHAKTNKYIILSHTQQLIPIQIFVRILLILLSFRLISRYFL